MKPTIEWNYLKSQLNQAKHGISFSEAAQLLLSDALSLDTFDANHSDDEDRLITIGSVDGRIILVVWTEPEGDVIRIVSARKATRREMFIYYKFVSKQ